MPRKCPQFSLCWLSKYLRPTGNCPRRSKTEKSILHAIFSNWCSGTIVDVDSRPSFWMPDDTQIVRLSLPSSTSTDVDFFSTETRPLNRGRAQRYHTPLNLSSFDNCNALTRSTIYLELTFTMAFANLPLPIATSLYFYSSPHCHFPIFILINLPAFCRCSLIFVVMAQEG
jgi:hypothetical protein